MIACVGECGVDEYVDIGLERPGGCSLNVAANLRVLAEPGVGIKVVSAIGDDAGSAVVRGALDRLSLGEFVRTARGPTPRQRIAIDSRNGEKHFCGYTSGVLASLSLDTEQRALVARADLVSTVVYSQVVDLFETVATSSRVGVLSADFMDGRDFGCSLHRMAEYLEAADIAFFGLADEDSPLSQDLRRFARDHTSTRIVVTLGAHGSVLYHGPHRFFQPATHLVGRPAVDTTGAGDAYAAAFLVGLLAGDAPQTAMRAASDHAALVVSRLGAFELTG
ncbi:MAG: hypothetical protein IT379_41985 [Deltaproteobacteria bacterium]|nr:hypothetical protein [Deltaproteobacteria bacterium]